MVPAAGVVSRVTGGVLSDTLFGCRRRPVVLLSFLVATPVIAGFTAVRTISVVVAALLVAGFTIQLCLGLVFASVRELVEPAVATTAVAFLTSVGLRGRFSRLSLWGGSLTPQTTRRRFSSLAFSGCSEPLSVVRTGISHWCGGDGLRWSSSESSTMSG